MKRYTAIIASLLILAGCAQEITQDLTPQSSESFDFTLEATLDSFDEGNLEAGATTKASATTVVRLSWNKGDEISVVNLTTGKALGGSLVADATGTTTTFSGTLNGTVNIGDQVAFLYPSQGYTEEQTYRPVTVDFSRQSGQSRTGVPICVFAKATASGPQFSGASATFKFLMSYIQFSFAGLGASEMINEVTVDGMGSSITLSLSADGFTAAPNVGTITMSPQSYSTTSTGTKAFYMSFAESPSVSKRNVTVWTDAGLKAGTFTGATLKANSSYTTIIASFKDAPVPFADENFKAYCVANFDTDGDGEISTDEAAAVTTIDILSDDITSLEGIRYFRNLESLGFRGIFAKWSKNGTAGHWSCEYGYEPASYDTNISGFIGISASGKLRSLDLSGLSCLRTLNVQRTMLEEINLEGCAALDSCVILSTALTELSLGSCPALTHFQTDSCPLTSLDVTNNTALTYLQCCNTFLTSLDVTNNTALTKLYCVSSQLTGIDITNNTALDRFWCTDNQLTSLDVSRNTLLTSLECNQNRLTSLDVSSNTVLTTLWCNYNQLTSLDITNNTALMALKCGRNQLTSLDVRNNAALVRLECDINQLTDLDVSNNTTLQTLRCNNNQLTELDVRNNSSLQTLWCNNNLLTNLVFSDNSALISLQCHINELTSLDVSKNTMLANLDCYQNHLISLDVSKNTLLTNLDCQENQLTSLDISKNTTLTYLRCNNNNLATLDVSENVSLESLNCAPMTSLAKLIMKQGQTIWGINVDRSPYVIPDHTIIEYRGDTDMEDGGDI